MHTVYFTAKELADLARCSKINIQKHIERGHIVSFRQGKYGTKRQGRHLISAAEAFRFLAKYRPQALSTQS
jgi:hypothetical protein